MPHIVLQKGMNTKSKERVREEEEEFLIICLGCHKSHKIIPSMFLFFVFQNHYKPNVCLFMYFKLPLWGRGHTNIYIDWKTRRVHLRQIHNKHISNIGIYIYFYWQIPNNNFFKNPKPNAGNKSHYNWFFLQQEKEEDNIIISIIITIVIYIDMLCGL